MQPLPPQDMPMQGHAPAPHPNQGFTPRQPSYNNGPDVNGLQQHMSQMNMASPGLAPQNVPYVRLVTSLFSDLQLTLCFAGVALAATI